MDYLLAMQKVLQKKDIDCIETLLTRKPWWDTVDMLAGSLVGALCAGEPELIKSHILRWAESDNIWLKRSAILFQLKYKEKTDTDLLSFIINKNLGSKEFFVNKAIGWVLREFSKTNKEWVQSFLTDHTLHPLSLREASKYL